MLEGLLLNAGGTLAAKIIAKRFGPDFGDLVQPVIGSLGKAFGVDAEPTAIAGAIQGSSSSRVESAVRQVEAETADLVAARTAQLKEVNRQLELTNQQLAEEKTEGWFNWAWRPAGMWLVGALWLWSVVILHVLNAIFKIALPPPDLGTLFALTGTYASLYMGGHTVKELGKNWMQTARAKVADGVGRG